MAALARYRQIQGVAIAQITEVEECLPVIVRHLFQIVDVDQPVPGDLIDGGQDLQ